MLMLLSFSQIKNFPKVSTGIWGVRRRELNLDIRETFVIEQQLQYNITYEKELGGEISGNLSGLIYN